MLRLKVYSFCLKKLALPLISVLVAMVLVFQAGVSLCPARYCSFKKALRPATLWPFINYPMYARPHYEGEAISRLLVIGTLDDTTEVHIQAADLGLGYWHFRRHLVNGLASDDLEGVKGLAALYENNRKRRLASLRLENHPLILSRDGVRSGAPQIEKELKLESPEKEN